MRTAEWLALLDERRMFWLVKADFRIAREVYLWAVAATAASMYRVATGSLTHMIAVAVGFVVMAHARSLYPPRCRVPGSVLVYRWRLWRISRRPPATYNHVASRRRGHA